jgi:hypothetical protein
MNADCTREEDVLEMLAARRWPDRCEEELEAHIRTCGTCGDLVTAAGALLEENEYAWREARVPAPAVVWWRAQVRGREEAARAAARPIAFIQGVAASCAVWVAVSLLRAFPLPLAHWRDWLAALSPGVPDLPSIAAAIPGGMPFLMAAGALLLLGPIALFFVLREALREE